MFAWLKGQSDLEARAAVLHEAIVAEARAPHLYAGLRVPDSLHGRLEMLVLHMILAVDRLSRAGDAGTAMARALTEAYVVAMDDTMRAIGVGDLSVPRKVKKAAAKLYDRHRSYGPALVRDASDGANRWHDSIAIALAEVDGATTTDLRGLAHYAEARVASLDATSDAVLLSGKLAA